MSGREDDDRVLQTMVHEFGHFFGAQDHYDNDCPSSTDLGSGYSRNCIYGEDKDSVAGYSTICSGCISDIKAGRDNYDE